MCGFRCVSEDLRKRRLVGWLLALSRFFCCFTLVGEGCFECNTVRDVQM